MTSSNTKIDNYAYIDILVNDSLFGGRWKHFCQVLDFKKGMMHELERMDNRNSPFSEIIMKILQHWISIASAEANPRNFAKKLRDIDCEDCAVSVEQLSGLSQPKTAEVGQKNTTDNANQQETNSEKDFIVRVAHISPIADLLHENLNKGVWESIKISWLSTDMINTVGDPKTMKLDIHESLRVWLAETPKKDRLFSKIRQVFAKQYTIADLLEENLAKWEAMT